MRPFLIFFIVVTLGYIIYYAAIITIDLNAKPKTDTDTSETLDTNGLIPDALDNPSQDGGDDDDSPFTEAQSNDNENNNQEDQTEDRQENEPNNEEIKEANETPTPSFDNSQELDDDPYGLGNEDLDKKDEALPNVHQDEATPKIPIEEPANEESTAEDPDEEPSNEKSITETRDEEPSDTREMSASEYLQENARRMMEGMEGVVFDDDKAYEDIDLKPEDIYVQEEPEYSVTIFDPSNFDESALVKYTNSQNEKIQAESRTPVQSSQLSMAVFEMMDVMKQEHFRNL